MIAMKQWLREIVEAEIDDATCAREDEGGCKGRLTVQHPYGRVIQERWLFLYLCHEHHQGKLQNLKKDKLLCLRQATPEDFAKYPKSAPQWERDKNYLTKLYALEEAP